MKTTVRLLALLIVVALVLAACPAPAEPVAPPAAVEPTAAPAAVEPTAAPAAEVAATEAPAADATMSDLKGDLKVWSFTNEAGSLITAFKEKNPGVNIEFTMIPMTNGEYQTKVKAAAGTGDAPDVVFLEAAFVREWVESDLLADQSDLLPLTEGLKTCLLYTSPSPRD